MPLPARKRRRLNLSLETRREFERQRKEREEREKLQKQKDDALRNALGIGEEGSSTGKDLGGKQHTSLENGVNASAKRVSLETKQGDQPKGRRDRSSSRENNSNRRKEIERPSKTSMDNEKEHETPDQDSPPNGSERRSRGSNDWQSTQLNFAVASPTSTVSMSQSQSQSQSPSRIAGLGSAEDHDPCQAEKSHQDSDSDGERRRQPKNGLGTMSSVEKPRNSYSAVSAPSWKSSNNKEKSHSTPYFEAPKYTWKINYETSDSESDSDDSDNDKKKATPGQKEEIRSTKNGANAKNTKLDSSSSSDEDNVVMSGLDKNMREEQSKATKQSAVDKDGSTDEEPSHKDEPHQLRAEKVESASVQSKASTPSNSPALVEKAATPNESSQKNKRKTTDERRSLNPLMLQQREQQKILAIQHQVKRQVDDDLLWDDDDGEVITRPRRQRQPRRRRQAALEDDGGRDDNGANDNRQVPGGMPVNDNDDDVAQTDDESYESEVDEEWEERKDEQHPNFLNPTFGPFNNEPLVLKNERTGETIHQVPASLSRYLPDFQREGIQFLYNAIANNTGVILGDDMGLGKTVQVISMISAMLGKKGTGEDKLELIKREKKVEKFRRKLISCETDFVRGAGRYSSADTMIDEFKNKLNLPDLLPILLIVPPSVVDNWHYEFSLWGHFSVALYRGPKNRERSLNDVRYGAAEVLIIGHSLFGSMAEFAKLQSISWKLVVVDEFHTFKTEKGKVAKNLRKLSRNPQIPVLGMTGTPMQNRYEELHNLLDLVSPNLLGDRKQFMRSIGDPIKRARAINATKDVKEIGERKRQELNRKMAPFYIQRKKTEVLKDMPEKNEKVVLCELSALQRMTYEHILDLPDYLLLRGAHAPCDCGVNINYFMEYQRLLTDAERIDYQRKNQFKNRAGCCYTTPKLEEKEEAVLWNYQHPHDEECIQCPYCILLPALSKLYSLSSHMTLLQFDRDDKSVPKFEREKREAFSKIAFPKEVIRKLPNGSADRCDNMISSREDHFAMSGKMAKLHVLLQKIDREKGRVLLFSYSTRTLDVIQKYMEMEGFRFLRIDGSTPAKDRQGYVDQFQNSADLFCFLLSTRAAGVGLNLTAANNVIIFDCEWNPANDEQAQDRSFRIGQKRDVTVYRLIAQGTIDELKYLRQIYKLQLKQETFRSAEGSDALAPPRSFMGVERDKQRKGELFGLENLLSFAPTSFMEKVWKTNKKRRSGDFIAHDADQLAKELGAKGGEDVLKKETEGQIQTLFEQARQKAIRDKESEPEEEALDHRDFFHQDRVETGYEDFDAVMGGETQAVDKFVMLEPTFENESAAESDDDGNADKDMIKTEDTIKTEDDKTPNPSPEKLRHSKAKVVASLVQKGKNFLVCGVSAKDIRATKTTFTMNDIFQPNKTP